MKKSVVLIFAMLFSGALIAQPIFNLGLRGGINSNKVTIRSDDFTSESVVKAHVGAFGRLGWSRIYLQPEIYYSAKGGKVLESGMSTVDRVSRFDFTTVDVPLLFGVKLIKGGVGNLRFMNGPVFCLMTSNRVGAGDLLDKEFYRNNYIAYQYGIGVDFLKFFLDARMEHGLNKLYEQPVTGIDRIDGRNQTFMLTVGFKIL
jgi:hypothetical protein